MIMEFKALIKYTCCSRLGKPVQLKFRLITGLSAAQLGSVTLWGHPALTSESF